MNFDADVFALAHTQITKIMTQLLPGYSLLREAINTKITS